MTRRESSQCGLLTKREDEVAGLVAEGLTNKEIAKRLSLSEHTVSNYLFRIYEKIGISSRVEFVLYVFDRREQKLKRGHNNADAQDFRAVSKVR